MQSSVSIRHPEGRPASSTADDRRVCAAWLNLRENLLERQPVPLRVNQVLLGERPRLQREQSVQRLQVRSSLRLDGGELLLQRGVGGPQFRDGGPGLVKLFPDLCQLFPQAVARTRHGASPCG